MKEIIINDVKYIVKKDYNDAIDVEEIKTKMTDYFLDFDYIVGDWSYSKLRLKGFYESNNKNVKDIIVHMDVNILYLKKIEISFFVCYNC